MKQIILFFLIFYSFLASAQQSDSQQKTIALYDRILTTAPREKIYVHFDKSTYLNIDTIWFKAYLINASVNAPSNLSGLIYTELINENGEVIQRLSLPTALGLTWGSFAINPNTYKPGKYKFRAYTNWMQNFGNEHFFNKDLIILPIESTALTAANSKLSITAKTAKADSSIKEKLRDIDVQFLPEGGSWLANRRQKMAFKALNINGKGIKVTGEIIDSKQNKIVSFSSNNKGMGIFSLHPQQDEIYTAIVNYNGILKSILLPKTKNDGIALKVENEYQTDSIVITSYSSLANQEVTIIGQARGIMCFVAKLKFNGINPNVFKIAKRAFPTGVGQVIVLDEKMKIINERNFFINHHDELKLSLSTPNTSYKLRDSIPIQLKVVGGKSNMSSFSIAVTDNNQVAKDTVNDETIISYFLMNSDLKGEIENLGYYFHQPDLQKHNDLEALMLTQGWVSYDWDLTKKPLFKAEKEYSISGKVSNIMNKPMVKAKIILLGTNKRFMLLDTITNEKGEFIFNKLPRLDSASFVIQAKNEKGKIGTIGIELNEFNPPLPPTPSQKRPIPDAVLGDSISKNLIATKIEEYKLTHRDGLLLNEVTIIGKKTIKGSKNLNGPGEADQIITDEELSRVSKKTLFDVLTEKVAGFRAGYPRKSTSREFFIYSNPLKFVIDGLEVDFFYSEENESGPDSYYHYIKSYLDYFQAEDIKGIEVMKNPRFSANYKSEFMDLREITEYSFIEITTKTGQGPFLKKSGNMYLLKPINYGDNKVFYSPKYTSQNKNDKKPDFRSTIYWQPNLLTNQKGEGAFSFFAADKPGSYTVWVEGTDLDGNFGFKTMKLTIK